jgi:biopolymer transport protein ExbD
MKLRRRRNYRRGRIEIIPMIDVMFFLLATFMLASLSLQNLHAVTVNLPAGTATPLQSGQSVTLSVTHAGALALGETPVTLDTLIEALRPLLEGHDGSIVVNADDEAPHGIVVQAMLRARAAGATRFLVAVKRE